MINVCVHCGAYRADKIIDANGPFAICPECGVPHRFVQLPLLVVSGASGAGKSAVCNALVGRMNHVVVLDSDILWRPEFDTPSNHYRDYFELWLRMCKNISQSGRPVVLFGAGLGVPDNIEPCVERRYFTSIEYLALTCNDDCLTQRLEMRPQWRGSRGAAHIAEQTRFNQWFKDRGATQPAIRLLDTSHVDVDATTGQVADWVNERLKAAGAQ